MKYIPFLLLYTLLVTLGMNFWLPQHVPHFMTAANHVMPVPLFGACAAVLAASISDMHEREANALTGGLFIATIIWVGCVYCAGTQPLGAVFGGAVVTILWWIAVAFFGFLLAKVLLSFAGGLLEQDLSLLHGPGPASVPSTIP